MYTFTLRDKTDGTYLSFHVYLKTYVNERLYNVSKWHLNTQMLFDKVNLKEI